MPLYYKTVSFFCVLMAVALFAGELSGFSRTPPQPEYVPGKLLVKFRDGVDEERIKTIVGRENGTVVSVLKSSSIHIIEVPGDVDIQALVERFSAYPEVLFAEPVWRAAPLEEK